MQQCSTKKHFENFIDVHKEFTNGSVDDFLKAAKCAPVNCEVHSWNQMVSFEESYSDDVTRSFWDEPPTGYTFNFMMRTFEVFNFSIHFKVSLKVRKSRNDFFKYRFHPKIEQTNSTLLL